MIYSYNRVSSKDQNLDRQIEAFKNWLSQEKIDENNCQIFCDKESGKDFERTNYQKMLSVLKENDLVVIKSIDRLGRNYDQIIEEWRKITKTLNCDIVVLDMPLLDTREKKDKLLGKFIADIVLQVLSFVAENERTNIKQRQAEGIKIAKEKGVKFGRDRKFLPPEQKTNFILDYINGMSCVDLENKYNICKSTIYKLVKDYDIPMRKK